MFQCQYNWSQGEACKGLFVNQNPDLTVKKVIAMALCFHRSIDMLMTSQGLKQLSRLFPCEHFIPFVKPGLEKLTSRNKITRPIWWRQLSDWLTETRQAFWEAFCLKPLKSHLSKMNFSQYWNMCLLSHCDIGELRRHLLSKSIQTLHPHFIISNPKTPWILKTWRTQLQISLYFPYIILKARTDNRSALRC